MTKRLWQFCIQFALQIIVYLLIDLQGHFCGTFFSMKFFCNIFYNFEQCDTVVYALCPLYTAMTIMPTLADANDTPFLSYSLLLTSALDQIRSK